MDPSASLTVNEEGHGLARFPGQSKGKGKAKTRGKKNNKPSQSTKLRGRDQDSLDVRISKTITWLLRHAGVSEGLEMRADGYVKVSEMVLATLATSVLP
jgi:2'-phosphotransferase